ncbi:transketolase C-terminal domain-containing protein, partial [Escherichia coli]|uniref:transketolase C-terminal domain-containing protein n=1 Tax=Escherichia coli TaxID=562 RepID=UPI0025A4F9CF
VVSYAAVLNKALEVADKLSTDGIDVEVIDLRCINPIDFDTIATSARKTSRVIIAHEDTFTLGIGAEIAARLADLCFFELDAPVMRVTAPDTP